MASRTSLQPETDWRARAAATRRQRSEQRIIGAAAVLFEFLGYEATTMEAIAERAGVGVATVYNRFGTKAAVVAAVVAAEVTPLLAAAERDISKGISTDRAVRSHLTRVATTLSEHREVSRALLEALVDETRTDGVAEERQHISFSPLLQEPLRQILLIGQQRGEIKKPVSPTETAMLMTNVMLIRLLTVAEQSPRRAAQMTADLFLEGIQTGARGQ